VQRRRSELCLTQAAESADQKEPIRVVDAARQPRRPDSESSIVILVVLENRRRVLVRFKT
jgi:hypothetical protein